MTDEIGSKIYIILIYEKQIFRLQFINISKHECLAYFKYTILYT